MTTREKLIEAATRAAMYSEVVTADHGDVARVDNWPEVIDAILDTLREAMPGLYWTVREASLGTDPDDGSDLPIWDNWETPDNSAESRGVWKAVVGYDIYHVSYDWPSWQEAVLTKAHHAMIDHIRSGK